VSEGGFPRLLGVQSDQRLLELARGGDQRAFETLVRRHLRPLIRYCRSMGFSDSRAEDVLQQALLQSWLALERGCEVHAPRAWLYRTVHNTAINMLRGPQDDHGPLSDHGLVDTSPSAESDFERRIALRQALSDVAALPQMQRDAILLTAIDGRSHEEIASALGVTHGAVRGLLYRARTTLRDAAAAVIPQPALLWASGLLGRTAPTAGRVAEISAPAGNTDVGAALAKGVALAATAAVLAVGTDVVSLPRHLAHRSKAAILDLGIGPATAEAHPSRSAEASGSATGLREQVALSGYRAPQRLDATRRSGLRSASPGGGRAEGGDGERLQPIPLSSTGGGSGDAGSVPAAEDGVSKAPSRPQRSEGPDATGRSKADHLDSAPLSSECSSCSKGSAPSSAEESAPQAGAEPSKPAAASPTESAETPAERKASEPRAGASD
jgi:RNA polymerase sigma factor (sigma-70 family)